MGCAASVPDNAPSNPAKFPAHASTSTAALPPPASKLPEINSLLQQSAALLAQTHVPTVSPASPLHAKSELDDMERAIKEADDLLFANTPKRPVGVTAAKNATQSKPSVSAIHGSPHNQYQNQNSQQQPARQQHHTMNAYSGPALPPSQFTSNENFDPELSDFSLGSPPPHGINAFSFQNNYNNNNPQNQLTPINMQQHRQQAQHYQSNQPQNQFRNNDEYEQPQRRNFFHHQHEFNQQPNSPPFVDPIVEKNRSSGFDNSKFRSVQNTFITASSGNEPEFAAPPPPKTIVVSAQSNAPAKSSILTRDDEALMNELLNDL